MKFQYQGSEFDLVDIVGEDNISRAERGDGMIISKDGMTLLLQHFPDIDCTFGELESFSLQGGDVLAVQACAYNRQDKTLPMGRSYGELNAKNADEFAMTYPVSTIENRGRNRAVLRHLGITGVFSEEELARIPQRAKPVAPTAEPTQTQSTSTPPANTNGAGSSEERRQLTDRVKTLCSELNWDDAKRVRLYCVALEIPKDTAKGDVAKKLTNEAIKKAIAIAEEKLAAQKG